MVFLFLGVVVATSTIISIILLIVNKSRMWFREGMPNARASGRSAAQILARCGGCGSLSRSEEMVLLESIPTTPPWDVLRHGLNSMLCEFVRLNAGTVVATQLEPAMLLLLLDGTVKLETRGVRESGAGSLLRQVWKRNQAF